MSARWNAEDFWPEVDYSKPPAQPPSVDWFIVVAWTLTVAASLLVWLLIVWIIWGQVA